jgi:hypothetical protein
MEQAISAWVGDHFAMLTEIYFEALQVDEDLADQVGESWNAGEVDNEAACILIAGVCSSYDQHGHNREA